MKKISMMLVLLLIFVGLIGCSTLPSIPDISEDLEDLEDIEDSPLNLISGRVDHDILGDEILYITIEHIGNKPIKAFTISAICKDAYGNVLKKFGFGDEEFEGIYQMDVIAPGTYKELEEYWTLYYDPIYEIEVTLESTIDIDDVKWERHESDDRYTITVNDH